MPSKSCGGTSAKAKITSPEKVISRWPPVWLPPLAVLVVALAWPMIAYCAIRAWQGAQNRVEDWLPASFPETQSLFDFVDRFGSDEFLMVSWDDCELGDPRAEELASLLLKPAPDGKVYFSKADCGSHVIDQLVDRRRISEGEAKRKLKGLFVGVDGKHSCVIALISAGDMTERKAAMKWVWEAARAATGLPKEYIHVAGITVDSIAIDEASNAYLIELNILSVLICFVILLFSLRNLWLAGTVILVALFHQHLALAFIYLSGGHIDSVQLLVANLCFVLTISAGLHYLGYFRKALQSHAISPAYEALRHAFLPTVLAAMTTSIGFVSLCTSELVPIRSFGFYSAVLVPVNAIVVLCVLSIHSSWAVQRTWLFRRISPLTLSDSSSPTLHLSAGTPGRWLTKWIEVLVTYLNRRPLTLIGLWIFAILSTGWGSFYLKSSVGTNSMLSADSKLVRDYLWLEERIGPLVPIELVLRFPSTGPVDSKEAYRRIRALDQLRRQVEGISDIKSTMSALTFLPSLPRSEGLKSTVRRAALGRIVTQSQADFTELRLLHEKDGLQSWRLSGRVDGSTTQDYELVLAKLQSVIDDFLADPDYVNVNIELSGGIPFIYRTQRQLLADLLSSFSIAFAMIAVTMAIVFRSLLAGLLLMIPNVTPAAVVFGTMGWLGMEVELGTVLTASVMMGVCVDNTLHLVSHFRSLRQQGSRPKDAVREALLGCGGAMVQTSLVCGLGMLALAFSPFTPVARFACLTFAMLMVGAISDLVVTPLLLLSPLNRIFFKGPEPKSQSDGTLTSSGGDG